MEDNSVPYRSVFVGGPAVLLVLALGFLGSPIASQEVGNYIQVLLLHMSLLLVLTGSLFSPMP